MILESREGSPQYGFMEYLEKNKNLLLKNYLIWNAETCVDVSSGALDFRVFFFFQIMIPIVKIWSFWGVKVLHRNT